MNLIRKGSSELITVGKSISITNKLLKEIENIEVLPNDNFRVAIPDANFQNYLIEEYNLEFADGTVAYGDIKGITKIDIGSSLKNWQNLIVSLEGVEYFTALTYLDCNQNELLSLNVSKNNDLSYLDCCWNQLTKLDISNNTALTYLNCWENQVTHLDVSENTRLTILYCEQNQLTSLDVFKNRDLIELNCSQNELTSLDLSKNTALTFLSSGANQLTSLDVSNNTDLTSLWCNYNQLTSIDLSKNPLLKKVRLEGNPGDWWKGLEKDEE